MKFPKIRKIEIVITIILLILLLFANFYTIRQVMRNGAELYFYDKMLVAYQIGKMPGLKDELENLLLQEKIPSQIALARDFKKNLGRLESPGEFLKDTTEELKKKIILFRKLRSIALGVILVIFILRIIIKRII